MSFTLVWSLEGFQAFKITTSMLFYFVLRVRLDLTNLYTDFVSLHHFCLFLVVESCLLSLTLFIHPCFKVWLKSSHHGLFVSLYFITSFVLQLWHYLYKGSSGSSRRGINIFFVVLYALYVLGSAAMVCWVIYTHSFPTFAAIATSVEQVCIPSTVFCLTLIYSHTLLLINL